MVKIVQQYVLDQKLSSGRYGNVYKGYNLVNKNKIVAKDIRKQKITNNGKIMDLIGDQLKLMVSQEHPNIIKLEEIIKAANSVYLMFEYYDGGDLGTYLKQKKILSEEEAIKIFIQILNGFKVLIEHKIVHGNLKLSNILLKDGQIKIKDFGFFKLSQNYFDNALQSRFNVAPQVLQGAQPTIKSDIWSIGMCLYEMLFGNSPFMADNITNLIKTIQGKPLKFLENIIKISSQTQDLLSKMLVVNPEQRIQWQDLLKHPIIHLFDDAIIEEKEED